jgi:hypothetical protein
LRQIDPHRATASFARRSARASLPRCAAHRRTSLPASARLVDDGGRRQIGRAPSPPPQQQRVGSVPPDVLAARSCFSPPPA